MVGFIHEIRSLDLKKLPSVSETIDWARVLVLLAGHASSTTDIVKDTLNVLLKYEADIEAATPQVTTFIAKAARSRRLRLDADAREPPSFLSSGARCRRAGLARRKHRCDARGRSRSALPTGPSCAIRSC